MADQAPEKTEVLAPAATTEEAPAAESKPREAEPTVDEKKPEATEAPAPAETEEKTEEKPAAKDDATEAKSEEKPADADVDMKDAAATEPAEAAADKPAEPIATPDNNAKNRRKSGAASAKGKTLNKKSSKARLTHTDAKPGDHFLVKLKGFPAWPAIICDEDMLTEQLKKTRPVTAARADGTYAENYAEGGKRVYDRNFPVMYLYTNENGWVINTAFTELSPEKAKESINDKMRKDLKAAFELASENHDLDFYKNMLQEIEEEVAAAEQAAIEAAATPKKSKKGKSKAADDEDEEMADAGEVTKSAKSKKRKADEATNRSDSVKKPKIKLTTSSTPKTANGTPKAKDESAAKSKAKPKKKEVVEEVAEAPKEELTPEERHIRKEKEVLYLRHKLQRGLLTRDQPPKESEMEQMSSFITMLEKYAKLEVAIIRATKINKVLKAILKLENIPREEEFELKKRSQSLLEKWNKLMATDATAPATTNGVNGTAVKQEAEKKTESAESKKPEAESKSDVKAEAKTEEAPTSDEASKAAPPETKETAEKPEEKKPETSTETAAPASAEA